MTGGCSVKTRPRTPLHGHWRPYLRRRSHHPEELPRRLADTEVANGFANRLLFAWCAGPSCCPTVAGSTRPPSTTSAEQVGHYARRAQTIGLVRRSQAADALWDRRLPAVRGWSSRDWPVRWSPGPRPRPFACRWRTRCWTARRSSRRDHLEAALAVWRYCEASAPVHLRGQPWAIRSPTACLRHPRGRPGRAGQHRPAPGVRPPRPGARLAHARAELERRGLVVTTSERTGGRDRRVTRARTNEARPGDAGA